MPRVLIVVQGGIGTLTCVHKAMLQDCPIVLICNSGGAATVIWQFLCTYRETGYGEVPQAYKFVYEKNKEVRC